MTPVDDMFVIIHFVVEAATSETCAGGAVEPDENVRMFRVDPQKVIVVVGGMTTTSFVELASTTNCL